MSDFSFIALDIETSGAIPLHDEICEIALIHWENNKIVNSYQTLVKTKNLIPPEIIAIHGIRNEMLSDAPDIKEVMLKVYDFIGNHTLCAHHAPFDIGFLCKEFEAFNLKLPKNSILCTSLISRKIFPECTNHKLQTLVNELKLSGGEAHRALDDAKNCMELLNKCIEKGGLDLEKAIKLQDKRLTWDRYSLKGYKQEERFKYLFEVIGKKITIGLNYKGGGKNGIKRSVSPLGMVRNPDGDYLVAVCNETRIRKRYYLDRIVDTRPDDTQLPYLEFKDSVEVKKEKQI